MNLQIKNFGEIEIKNDGNFFDVIKNLKIKNALAVKINEKLYDLAEPCVSDGEIEIITPDTEDGLEILRHSMAHLMAHAVKTLYPDAQVTIGPTIENGFYYDFHYPKGFNPEDLEKIERQMRKIVKAAHPLKREVIKREAAVELFESMGEHYKAQIISDLPEGEVITLYRQDDFVDLCRGPHVPNTRFLKAFKLTKVAGAYWRGDEKNEMLQRIYGTAWADEDQLQDYLRRIAEAEKRDHRKLAKVMDLFHMQDIAPGMVFWHDKGHRMYRNVIEDMRGRMRLDGYEEIATPLILDQSLWRCSGHWDKFRDDMFVTKADDRTFCVKPMNCPGGLQVFNTGLKSYRDLPLKVGEFGFVHRNEGSGALHGLMRLRAFTQDDAHVFCTESQLGQEVTSLIDFVYNTYKDYGFNSIIIKVATRPEKRIGTDEEWDLGEKALMDACTDKKIPFEIAPGEGAFYGPKIEFHLKDSIGRIWQCGTIQVDYSMPERLDATYISAKGQKTVPIMVHRAIFGSIERFLAILLEHYGGILPLWLAPVQVLVAGVSDQFESYAKEIKDTLFKRGIHAEFDSRSEKLGLKIRESTLRKVPYMIIVGEKEITNNTISVRCVNGKQKADLKLDEFIQLIEKEITTKFIPNSENDYLVISS